MEIEYNKSGIYAIVNRASKKVYLGQTRNLRKRVLEHQRLLESNKHQNPHLQNAFNKYGREFFDYEVVVICDDPNDLDEFEAPFLDGTATYDLMPTYNIAKAPTAPMAGRKHSEETKNKMRLSQTKRWEAGSECGSGSHRRPMPDEIRKKITESNRARFLNDPDFMESVAKIVSLRDGSGMSFDKIAIALGINRHASQKRYEKYKEYLTNG